MNNNYILIPITIWMLIACSKAGSTNVNPILDYSITDYISYESSTKKVPSDRNTQFNILDSASKYVYFAIPSASS